MLARGGELLGEPCQLRGCRCVVGLAGAGGVIGGEEYVVEDKQSRMRHGDERNAVIATGGEVAQNGGAVLIGEACGEGFGDDLGGVAEERVVRGVELIVAAAGVVVAHRNVERDAGQRRAQREDDRAHGLFGEGKKLGGSCRGQQRLKLAVVRVGQQVAAERDKPGARGVGANRRQARLPQDIRCVDAARGAGLLQRGDLLRLRGRVWRGEDRGPLGGGRRVQPRGLGRVGEGIQVNV